jgi:hypothetical protein
MWRVFLQTVEHRPPIDDRQPDVQGDRRRLKLLRQRQRGISAACHHRFESLLVCDSEQDASEFQIVLDDQQHAVGGVDVRSIVFDRSGGHRLEFPGDPRNRDRGAHHRPVVGRRLLLATG